MAKKRILCFGSAGVRLDAAISAFPAKGEEIRSFSRYSLLPEGSGLALAMAAQFLGAEALLCAGVGDDFFGERLRALCREHGLDTRFLFPFKGERTTLALHFRESGAARRIYFEGAGEQLSQEEAEQAFLSLPDALLCSSELSGVVLPYVLGLAAKKETRVFYRENDEVHALPSPVFCYAVELEKALRLTGEKLHSDAACMRCAIKIAELVQTRYTLLFLPSGGIFLYDGTYGKILPPLPADPLDPEGAQEVFLAAFAVELLAGAPVQSAVSFAFAAKALTEAQRGYMESFPDRDEVQFLLRKSQS